MLTYIITRFSIFDENCKFFNIQHSEQYKKKLFNTIRLDYKFNLFENVTLPSIVNQTNQNFIWYIYASEYMPPYYRIKLCELTKKYKNINCVFIKSFDEFNKFKYIDDKFCTVRLDDDDYLNKDFIEKLNKYKNEKKETIISFPYGNQYVYNTLKNKIIIGKETNYNLIALGLTCIDDNIYRHSHSKIDFNTKNVILDDSKNMYLIHCGHYCDSGRPFDVKPENKREYLDYVRNKVK